MGKRFWRNFWTRKGRDPLILDSLVMYPPIPIWKCRPPCHETWTSYFAAPGYEESNITCLVFLISVCLFIMSCVAHADGQKRCYDQNYETLLKLMRVGGVIAVDNILWKARVADTQVCICRISCRSNTCESESVVLSEYVSGWADLLMSTGHRQNNTYSPRVQ